MKKQHRKPAWRKVRLPTASPGHRHSDDSKYRRGHQPTVDEFIEEYGDDDEEEGSMFESKCKRFCADTFETLGPLALGLVLGFFVLMPILQYTQEKVYPKISEAWSMAWHLGETARVVKQPTDSVLVDVLETAGFDVLKGNETGQVKFSSGLWSAMLFNDGYKIKLSAGFKGIKVAIEDANKWNRNYIYTKMYLDPEGDPFLQSDMYLGVDGASREALTGFFRMYGKALDNFVSEQLKEGLTNFLEELGQEKTGAVSSEISL